MSPQGERVDDKFFLTENVHIFKGSFLMESSTCFVKVASSKAMFFRQICGKKGFIVKNWRFVTAYHAYREMVVLKEMLPNDGAL